MQRSLLLVSLALFLVASTIEAQTSSPYVEPQLSEEEIQRLPKLPTRTILIKGAEPSASDSVTPLPEWGEVVKNVYRSVYFGLSYPLPEEWRENFSGPPPSDSGLYVLALAGPSEKYEGTSRATLLIQAHDLFFSPAEATSAMDLATFAKETLESHYDLERGPHEVKIGHRTFVRFDYKSEVAGLHWIVLTTEIRCHAVQFIFTSSDVDLLNTLITDMGRRMQVSFEGAEVPRCIANYAEGSNVTNRVEPVIKGAQRFNSIPVRIIIDRRGRVRHIHTIRAFPDQAAAIQDALMQWTFVPHEVNGQRVEVETGILFGYPHIWPKRGTSAETPASE